MKPGFLILICTVCVGLLSACGNVSYEEQVTPVEPAVTVTANALETVQPDGTEDPLEQTIALYQTYRVEIERRFPGIEMGQMEAWEFENLLAEADSEEARQELGELLNQEISGVTRRVFIYMENERKMGNGEIEGAQEFLDEYARKFEAVDWTDQN